MMPRRIILPATSRQSGGLLVGSLDAAAGWEAGVSFTPNGCLAPTVGYPCVDDPAGSATVRPAGVATFYPVNIRQGVQCSALGDFDTAGYAAATLNVTAEGAVGSEFETGAATGNPALVDGTSVGSGASVLEGLACLEQAAADLLSGRQVWIHVPPKYAQALTPLRWDNGVWRTVAGSVVIVSPGYTGDAIYASGDVYTATNDPDTMSALNRENNTLEGWGVKYGIAYADPCTFLTVEVPPVCGEGE